jgi:alpha-L-fucosidase
VNTVPGAQSTTEDTPLTFSTTKGNTLYAFVMGWPEGGGQILIRPLATNNPQNIGTIESVELLGVGKVDFERSDQGLTVALPAQKPGEHAYAFKISGKGLI